MYQCIMQPFIKKGHPPMRPPHRVYCVVDRRWYLWLWSHHTSMSFRFHPVKSTNTCNNGMDSVIRYWLLWKMNVLSRWKLRSDGTKYAHKMLRIGISRYCLYPPKMIHWHYGSHVIATMQVKWYWQMWVNATNELSWKWKYLNSTKQ